MAILKNVTTDDTGFLLLPSGTTAQRPAAQVGMIRFNTTISNVEYYSDQGVWLEIQALPFKERTIITTAYTAGGYANSVAWNNVNRTVAATDTTTNLGDSSMERSFNYQAAACNKTTLFIFGAGNGHAVSSNYVIAYNMVTETQATSGFSRTMGVSRIYGGMIFEEDKNAFITGGNVNDGSIEEYNMTTQTVVTTGLSYTGSEQWGMSHEKYGIFYGSETNNSFDFATWQLTSRGGTAVSGYWAHHAVNSKLINCYAGNESSLGDNYRRTNMIVNTTSGTLAKPVAAAQEENMTLGQDWQYMIGMYNGAQNNISSKFTYASETGAQGTSTLEPKGKTGSSSACNGWRP